jgi:chromosome segregation ATPase
LVTAALLMQLANALADRDEQRCVEKLVRAWIDCAFDDGSGGAAEDGAGVGPERLMKRQAIKHHTAIHEADPKGSAVARKILSEPEPEPYSSQVHNLRMLAGRMRAESAETQAVLTAETARFNTQAKRTRRLEKMEKKLRDEVNSMEKELKRQHLRLNSLQEEAQEAERRHKAAVKEFVERRDQVSELEAEAELRENISAENERRLDISYNAEKENREQLAEYEERERSLGTKILQLQKYVETEHEPSEKSKKRMTKIRMTILGKGGKQGREDLEHRLSMAEI